MWVVVFACIVILLLTLILLLISCYKRLYLNVICGHNFIELRSERILGEWRNSSFELYRGNTQQHRITFNSQLLSISGRERNHGGTHKQSLSEPLLWRDGIRYLGLLTSHVDFLIKRCEQDNQEVRNVEDEIIRRMDVREKTWTQDLDDGRTPVLVFCVNASRIGTDIESALKGVRNHRPVLVVLHCKNPSSLRGDLSDDDYLLDQALRDRVTGIAHFAFSEFDGFYSCRQNDDGYRILSDLITKAEM